MEFINDILREMREELNQSWWDVDREKVHGFADRIEKAARHEMSDEFSAEIQKLTDELYEVKKANIRLKAELNKDDCLKLANDVDRLRAENDRLKAALVASNDELNLARSNSRSMYKRLNDENLRITEMDRETIHGLRDENERLKAALQPVLDCDVTKESYLAQSEVVWISQRIWKEGR